jgi:hypothetical protein
MRLIGAKYLVYAAVINMFFTRPGVRQGFTFKELVIFGCILGKWFRIPIPIWIVSYDRKKAEDFERLIQEINNLERKFDNETE